MLQRANAFATEGQQRWVVVRIDRGCLCPDGSLALPPGGPFADLDSREARPGQPGGEVHPAQPVRQLPVVPANWLPAGQRHPPARLQDPADFAVGSGRIIGKLDRVRAQHRVRAGARHPGGGEIADPNRASVTPSRAACSRA
jgi:hypothetical protein